MQSPILTRYYTPEEYIALEEKADVKHEYRDGEIIPMTGGTTDHNTISLSLAASLRSALRGKNYSIYMGDVRLWIPRYRQYTYPDVMVIEGKPIYKGKNKTTVTNPSLIAEVLSKSTKNYDQGDKFLYYRSIPELKEYILIDQTQPHVMQYVKTAEGQWLFTEYESESTTLSLDSIQFEISFSGLYEEVDFDDSEEESE